MHRETLLIVLAALVTASTYVGLPYLWLMFILPLLGLSMLFIALSLRIERRKREDNKFTLRHEAPPEA